MEIKANELRIGNYVYWSVNPYKNNLEEITGIFIDTEGLVEKDEMIISTKTMDGELFSEFKPIPLTEERLLDFGFEYFEEHSIGKGYRDKISIRLNKDGGFYYVYGIGEYSLLKYVHELQNLVFALTKKELTL